MVLQKGTKWYKVTIINEAKVDNPFSDVIKMDLETVTDDVCKDFAIFFREYKLPFTRENLEKVRYNVPLKTKVTTSNVVVTSNDHDNNNSSSIPSCQNDAHCTNFYKVGSDRDALINGSALISDSYEGSKLPNDFIDALLKKKEQRRRFVIIGFLIIICSLGLLPVIFIKDADYLLVLVAAGLGAGAAFINCNINYN